jgi:hypothetical protein
MSARHAPFIPSTYDTFDPSDHGEVVPGERVGPPIARAGGKIVLRGGIILLIAFAAAWAMLGERPGWPDRLASKIAAMARSLERTEPAMRAPSVMAAATPSVPATREPATKLAALDAPPGTPTLATGQPPLPPLAAAKPEAPPPLTTAALPPAAAAHGSAAPPLVPPSVDPSDPYQVRAAAVGLHPELSRVLLARLSPTDYRNAGIAIQTAITDTPDNAVFAWPRQRKPELALFRVRFVAGAAPGCRRYVVTVVKDGWLTTALPMEKCKPEPNPTRRR